jgi:riboflavin synthase alpha subunit
MFTGIITDIGRITELAEQGGGRRLVIETRLPLQGVAVVGVIRIVRFRSLNELYHYAFTG